MLIIRPIIAKDQDILRLATFYNLNWNEERFSLEEIDSNPQFSHYYTEWGKDDFGFAAQRHLQIFGIVWVKHFSEKDPGFGFIDDETPELSLSIFPEYRNSGFGTKLLQLAIKEAKEREIQALSLSVEFENKVAVALYEKLGFRYFEGTEGTMMLDLL